MNENGMTFLRTIRLSNTDLTYLANSGFLPEELSRIVGTAKTSDSDGLVLSLDEATAEQFRDEFTARLARVGFGPDYEPTREGKLLEDLIDRFAG